MGMNTNIFIWGYAKKGQQIEKFLLANDIEVTAIIDRSDKISDKCISFEVFLKEYDIDKSTIFLGTIRKSIEQEMTESIRRLSDKAVIVGIYDFHHMYEVPYYLNENNGYHVDFIKQFKLWLENISDEVLYWKDVVVNGTGISHTRYLDRILEKQFVCDRLKKHKISEDMVVLDVGCGVCTQYGNKLDEGKTINLIGFDPLASVYNELNAEYAENNEIVAPPKVTFGLFEIMHMFKDNQTADIVLIDNALDHCIDPAHALLSCFYVLKVGGVLSLRHSVDEAMHAAYNGLHQWNLICSNKGDFIIWNDKQYFNVTEALCKYAKIETYMVKEKTENLFYGSVICNIVKEKEIPSEYLLGKANAGKIMELFMTKYLKSI